MLVVSLWQASPLVLMATRQGLMFPSGVSKFSIKTRHQLHQSPILQLLLQESMH